jgi:hypothetical protein
MNHMPRIIQTADEHKEWCSKEISLALGVSWSHVRMVGCLKGLKFADGNARAKQVPGLRKLKPIK